MLSGAKKKQEALNEYITESLKSNKIEIRRLKEFFSSKSKQPTPALAKIKAIDKLVQNRNLLTHKNLAYLYSKILFSWAFFEQNNAWRFAINKINIVDSDGRTVNDVLLRNKYFLSKCPETIPVILDSYNYYWAFFKSKDTLRFATNRLENDNWKFSLITKNKKKMREIKNIPLENKYSLCECSEFIPAILSSNSYLYGNNYSLMRLLIPKCYPEIKEFEPYKKKDASMLKYLLETKNLAKELPQKEKKFARDLLNSAINILRLKKNLPLPAEMIAKIASFNGNFGKKLFIIGNRKNKRQML